MGTGSRSVIATAIAASVVAASCGGGDDGNTVTFRAEGVDVTEADVTYVDGEGLFQQETVELPWSVSFDTGDEYLGEMTVTNPTDTGSVACSFEPGGFRPVEESGEVSAKCGGSFQIDGSTANGSFFSDREDRGDVSDDDDADDDEDPGDDEPAAGAPVVTSVVLSGGTGPDGSFGPFDSVTIEVELGSMPEEVVIDVEANTAPPGPGDSKSLEAGQLLRRGSAFDGDEATVTEDITAPGDGWIEGDHAVAVEIELRSSDDEFEPVQESFDLQFTVAAPEVSTVAFESSDGQIRFDHPSDWDIEESTPSRSYTSNTDFGPAAAFDSGADSLRVITAARPLGDDPGARVQVYVEQARFTAPAVDEWIAVRLDAFVASGVDITSDEIVDRDHGPVRRVVGTFEDESVVVDFTQSADRLYIVEFVAKADADPDVVAAGAAVFDSVVLVPDAEPLPTPMSEARSVSFTVEDPDGSVAADVSFSLPATWDMADGITEPAPSRFLLRSNGPARTDGFEAIQGYLYLELLDSPPTTEDYAQFWIDRSAEEFAPAGYELIEQSADELNLEPAVRSVWRAAGEVVDEVFVVSGDVGITLRFEFQEGTEDPRLLDAVAPELFVLPNN